MSCTIILVSMLVIGQYNIYTIKMQTTNNSNTQTLKRTIQTRYTSPLGSIVRADFDVLRRLFTT